MGLRLTMSDITAKVFANDDMPGRTMLSVKLLLDLCSDVLLDGVFFESSGSDVDALLLQLLAHVYVFDDGLWGGGCTCFSWGRAGVCG